MNYAAVKLFQSSWFHPNPMLPRYYEVGFVFVFLQYLAWNFKVLMILWDMITKGMVPLMQPASFSSSPNQDNCPGASNVAIARWQLNLVNTIGAGLGMAIHIMKATQILDPLIHQTLHLLYLRIRNNGRIIWGINCVSVYFTFMF